MNPENSKDPAEKHLDDLLDSYTVLPASRNLHSRILSAAVDRHSKPKETIYGALLELILSIGGWRVAAPALALSLISGVALNAWISYSPHPDMSVTIWELSMLTTQQESIQ